MAEQLTTWNGKNILKIKSEPLREVELSNGDADDSAQDSPEKLRTNFRDVVTYYAKPLTDKGIML